MSRDLTPRQWDDVHRYMPELDPLKNSISRVDENGSQPLHSEEDLEYFKIYPRLRLCGLDFLMECKERGILNSSIGRGIIHAVDGILAGHSLPELRDLEEKVNAWYDGFLAPGRYMDANDLVLIEEIEKRMKEFEENPNMFDGG